MSRKLSTSQIEAMRVLDPKDDYNGEIEKRTLNSLRRRKLVDDDSDTLTSHGLKAIRYYVRKTGNGPERLKSLFKL